MTHCSRVVRVSTSALVLTAIILSAGGCAVVRQVPRHRLPPIHIPGGVTDDLARDIARQVEQTAATRERASADLLRSGLDFTCALPVDDQVEPAFDRLREEVERRAHLTSGRTGLSYVHDAYTATLQEMDLSVASQAGIASGITVIATYCAVDSLDG